MVTKKDWKLVDTAMADVLDKLYVIAPNTGYVLSFSIDGLWEITDTDGKIIKKYKIFENAIDYLLENN